MDIAKILKNCPVGTKLFCSILGPCNLYNVSNINGRITVQSEDGATYVLNQEGKLPLSRIEVTLAECILFPSKENRDWSKFEKDFLLSQYSTEALRAELKKRNAEKKALRQKEFDSAHRCRNCKFFGKEPNSLFNSHICMARTWGKTIKRHYIVNGSHGLQCDRFVHK
jgi:hypothetical protein